jgi:NADPH:quinone reductase-like Zn-dependent oxidoreductase
MMRRIQYNRYGGPEVMELSDFEIAPPRNHEVLVRVAAASINPFDWKLRQGDMKMLVGSKFPRAMGSDFSGTVEGVGSKVTRFAPGDDVVGSTPPKGSGAFAEMVLTLEKRLVKKPPNLAHTAAAVLPTPAVTAWAALVQKGKLRKGQRVFLNGAFGGVGRAAIAIAQERGASVAGRVGPADIDEALSMGLAPALDYNNPTPSNLAGTFDVVFDCNGSLSPEDGKKLVNKSGVVVDINISGAKLLRAMLSPRRKIALFNGDAELLGGVIDLASAGKLCLPIGESTNLDGAIAMITRLERNERSRGKSVIEF